MTGPQAIKAAFHNTLGKFTLDTTFEVPARGVTALFGPSGCGKTTVLRCIAGLIRVKDGYFDIDGEIWQDRDLTFLPTYRRPLGYVFQEASLFPHMSVRRNLLFGAPPQLPADRPAIDFDEVVDLLGIRALLDRSPRNLSGGERQRVGIGRALLTQPRLLLMDEPLSALDRATKGEILPFIEKLRDHFALPIFYITHDMNEVERLADTMILLDKGHIVASGLLADLQSDPALPLAMGRGAAVTLDGRVEAYDAAYGLLTVGVRGGRFIEPAAAAPVGEPRRVRVIASDVSLAREPPSETSILNIGPGRVVEARPVDGHEIVAVVSLGADGKGARLLSRLTRKAWDQLALADGAPVYVQVKAVSLSAGRGE